MIILFQAILQSKPGKIVLLEAYSSGAARGAESGAVAPLQSGRSSLSPSAESTAAVRRPDGGPTAACIKAGGAAGAALLLRRDNHALFAHLGDLVA